MGELVGGGWEMGSNKQGGAGLCACVIMQSRKVKLESLQVLVRENKR